MFKQNSSLYFIYTAAFLRSLGIGLIAVFLAIFLTHSGFTKTQIGIVVSIGLIGAGLGNLFVSIFGDRIGRKRVLIAYALLSGLGALALCYSTNFYSVLIAAFFGMINARGKDRGAALAVESAILPSLQPNTDRTKAYAFYSLIQDVGLAVGAIAAGIPTLLTHYFSFTQNEAFQATLLFYGFLMSVTALCYLNLSNKAEIPAEKVSLGLSKDGKKIVTKLASLFAIDSLAGGFLTSTLIAYYFYERFHIGIEIVGIIFFVARCLNAVSYFGAVWLSKRIGLINAMVFTHSPSHLFLICIAFAPTFPIAVTFYLLRELLVEMDVPTRQSYVMAVVKPEDRVKAAGITQLVRMMGWAVAPVFAGYVMQNFSLASPLYIGAGIKLTYDALIFLSFRKVKPPEEPTVAIESAQTVKAAA